MKMMRTIKVKVKVKVKVNVKVKVKVDNHPKFPFGVHQTFLQELKGSLMQ
jgi:hypothetical protein